MKLFLHIGMPKAGSTALQQTLGKAAPDLLRHGICYPVGGGLPQNHNLIVCGLLEPTQLPRLFRQVYAEDEQRMRHDVEAFMTTLRERAAASGAHTVILSGEMLFLKLGPKKIDRLREMFAPLADEITVVAYVRSPSQFYMSQVQQVLKASHRILAPGPRIYRAPLESWEALTDEVRVATYAREHLHGGDITRDFLHRLSPGLEDVLQERHLYNSNQTLSAEGMDILQKYRKYSHSQENGQFTSDTKEVIRLITAVEGEISGFTKPVAHAHLQDYLSRTSVDLLWLRNRHGITFDDIDYDRITDDLTPPPAPKEIADICAIDPHLRDRLMMTVVNRLAQQATGKRKMKFMTAMPPKG